jgi:hypothetical protein
MPGGVCLVCVDEINRERSTLDGVNRRHLALLCATGKLFSDIPAKPHDAHTVSINGGNGVIFA